MNPASLEAEISVARAYSPRQGGLMFRGEPQEQAKKTYAARARKRERRTYSLAWLLRQRPWGGDGVEVSSALGVLTATLRKMAKLSDYCITFLEHVFRQRRFWRWCATSTVLAAAVSTAATTMRTSAASTRFTTGPWAASTCPARCSSTSSPA